ncbi:MAG: thiosulfate oxidation carrier complex protein SoxZ [Pseudomonadota bacterium]
MSTVKIRTRLRDGKCTVRALLKHPMSVGSRRRNREPHFIRLVECIHNGTLVMRAHWGAGIAANPYLSFTIEDAREGDTLSLRWEDNRDQRDELTVSL